MARIEGKQVVSTQPGTTASAAYTVPTGKSFLVTGFDCVNAATTVQTLDVHFVPSAGSATNANKIWDGQSFAGNEHKRGPGIGQYLDAGDSIQLVCDAAAKITVTISGIETVI